MTWLLAFLPGIVTKLFGAAIEIATPIAVAAVQLLIWYLKKLWEGLVDVSDNLGSILLVLSLCFGTYVGTKWYDCSCPTAIVKTVKPKAPIESWRPW
jgi:hypothetical protein